jgi:ABC transporter substrate binding protein
MKVALVGILSDENRPRMGSFEPFVEGVRDLAWAEGQNISFELSCAAGNQEILPSLAAELVRLRPNVILAVGTRAARAAKIATETVPIVFSRIADPSARGLNSAAVARQVRPLATEPTYDPAGPANRVLPFHAGPQPQPQS